MTQPLLHSTGASPVEQSAPSESASTQHARVPADHAGYYDCGGGGYFYVERPADRDQIDWSSEVVRATAPASPRRNPWYDQITRPRGVEFWRKSWLPAPPGEGRGFFVVREAAVSSRTPRDSSAS